jgi:hypothetical protein
VAAHTTLVIKHDESVATASIVDKLVKPAAHKAEFVTALLNFLTGLASGAQAARVDVKVDDVTVGDYATTFATFDTVIETDVILIGPVTLTFDDTPTGENQMATGDDDTDAAANAAAAINAHSVLAGIVSATSAAAVLTITSLYPGPIGEFIAVSSPDGTITVDNAYLEGVTSTNSATFRSHTFGQA